MSVQLVPFETELEELEDGSVCVDAHGELDLATASRLEEALEECAREHPRRLVVDLADVPFVDAAGLRVLISAHDRQERDGGEFAIRRPSRPVLRLLELAQPRVHLDVVPD